MKSIAYPGKANGLIERKAVAVAGDGAVAMSGGASSVIGEPPGLPKLP